MYVGTKIFFHFYLKFIALEQNFYDKKNVGWKLPTYNTRLFSPIESFFLSLVFMCSMSSIEKT